MWFEGEFVEADAVCDGGFASAAGDAGLCGDGIGSDPAGEFSNY